MKNIRFILLALVVVFFAGPNVQAGKTEEIKIKVTFHCVNGKALIEKELLKEDGVSSVVADLETKVVTIQYDSEKQTREKLVTAIEKIGYATEFTKEGTEINKACSHH